MNEMVTITKTEYQRLRDAADDLDDLHSYDRAKAALAAGDEELIPAEHVARIIDGESPLRVFRDLRGLTQQQLAEASGVNRVQIADIESGRKTGSVETVKKLASALGVALEDLV